MLLTMQGLCKELKFRTFDALFDLPKFLPCIKRDIIDDYGNNIALNHEAEDEVVVDMVDETNTRLDLMDYLQ